MLLEPPLPVWLLPHTLRPGEGDGGHAVIAVGTGSNQVSRGRSFETCSSYRLSMSVTIPLNNVELEREREFAI